MNYYIIDNKIYLETKNLLKGFTDIKVQKISESQYQAALDKV